MPKILARRKEGYAWRDIAAELGVGRETMMYQLKKAGHRESVKPTLKSQLSEEDYLEIQRMHAAKTPWSNIAKAYGMSKYYLPQVYAAWLHEKSVNKS
jgi:IS30 family transposase